jgi:hypothetical protein
LATLARTGCGNLLNAEGKAFDAQVRKPMDFDETLRGCA